MNNKITSNLPAILLLSIIFVLNVLSIRHLSITTDEPHHINYGVQILKLNSERYIDGVMPITALNAVPKKIGDFLRNLMPQAKYLSFFYKLNTARYVTILFSVLLGFYIYKWVNELYGKDAAIFSLLLYTFSPNIIAHSQLVTGDLYAAVAVTISLYYFWKFLNNASWKNCLISAFILGLSQLAKGTCIYLYPIFLLIIFIKYSSKILNLIRAKNIKTLRPYIKVFTKYSLVFLVLSILIINIGFLFNKTGMLLKEYYFRHEFFINLKGKFPNLIVPFPHPFISNMDWVKYNERTGVGCGYIYLFGKLQGRFQELKGFKGYYFYTFLFKEPIATQILLILAIIYYIKNRKKYNFMRNELIMIVPILFFIIYFNFFYRRQIGIRHTILIFPLLYIWTGSLFSSWRSYSKKIKVAATVLIIYLTISMLSYFPHYIPYFNELVWDRKQAYKIISDSNIDWGQGRWYLEQYLQNHPKTNLNPPGPVPGKVIVGVNDLVGVFDPYRFQWLRDNFKPTDHITYSYLVFDVPKESIDALKKMYPVQNKPTDNITIQK